MKTTAHLSLLLMAANWLLLAQSDVRLALKCDGKERAAYLSHARSDASCFRYYAALWHRATQAA